MRSREGGGEVCFKGGGVEGSADNLFHLASVDVDTATEFCHVEWFSDGAGRTGRLVQCLAVMRMGKVKMRLL